jgi:HEAT repeat protein
LRSRLPFILRLRLLPIVFGLACCTSVAFGCVQSAETVQPDEAVKRLLDLLHNPSVEMRRTAALSLGKIGRPEAAPGLIQSLKDPDALVRQYSAWALGNLGEDVTEQAGPPLVSLLEDPSPGVRAAAGQGIGQLRASEQVVRLLMRAAQHRDPEVRLASIRALAWLEARPAYPVLLAALEDPEARVRQAAIAALGELGDDRSVRFIAERLHKDPDPAVRSEAAFRLGKLGGPAVIPLLQVAAKDDRDGRVRRWAIAALDSLRS